MKSSEGIKIKNQVRRTIFRSCERASLMYLLSITNKMQRYTIVFIIVNDLHVAYSSKLGHIPDAVCTVFELLMMGGKTVRNM